MNILNKLYRIFLHFLGSREKEAKFIGVKIGKNCLIGTRNWSSEPYLITIGNNVQVTKDVYFHTHGGAHVARHVHPKFDIFGKIVIEDDAYIGSGSHIMPGVTIGKGSLVAAGSVVSKSIPPREMWGGVPAKFICTVDDYIERNLPYNLDSKGLSHDEKKEFLLKLDDSKFIKK